LRKGRAPKGGKKGSKEGEVSGKKDSGARRRNMKRCGGEH